MDVKILNNRYQLNAKIGAGGMGSIYEADDLYLKRKVAIKIVNQDSKIDDLNQERFLQEITAVSRIRHPNVIFVYDIFMVGKNLCLVLELLRGKTLKQYLTSNGILSVTETINVFKEILAGIAACHEAGVIHRDIKPDNIFITNNGKVKVLDFGISIVDDQEIKKNQHQVVGTMKYIDPEIVKFKKATITSDIYAVGIMMYEVLLGKPPFFHKNAHILASKHIKEPMPMISEYNSNIPSAVEKIILKATEKKPINRYQNAKEMINDLNAITEKNNFQIISKSKKNKVKKVPFYCKTWFTTTVIILVISIIIVFVILSKWLK